MLFASGECKYQPDWLDVFRLIARVDSDEAERREARERLEEYDRAGKGDRLKCSKLKMVDGACHACQENPRKDQAALDWQAYEQYQSDLQLIGELHDALRLGLVHSLAELEPDEWDMIRLYDRKIRSLR